MQAMLLYSLQRGKNWGCFPFTSRLPGFNLFQRPVIAVWEDALPFTAKKGLNIEPCICNFLAYLLLVQRVK